MEVECKGADFFPQKPTIDGARGPRCAEALLSMTTSGLAPYLSSGHASTKFASKPSAGEIYLVFCLD